MLTTALQFLQACQVWGMRGMVFPGIWVPWFSGHLVFLQTCRVQLKVGEEVLANLFLLMEDKLEPGKRFRDYDLLAETKVNHEMSVDIDAQVQDLGFKVLRINHCGFGLRGLLIYDILI